MHTTRLKNEKHRNFILFSLALLLLYLFYAIPCFAEGKAEPLHFVANTEGLSGVELWYANLYNSNKFYCALVTVIIIPIVGFILGVIADFIISKIGLDLKSRVK
ncbi:MAG: DVU0150 family protein [bacterium]